MFTRKDALELLAATFPEEDITSTDYENGGTKTIHWDAEKHLQVMIDIQEPHLDALKTEGEGLDAKLEQHFRDSVDHDYKNKHGLWP
jgi:hypothetical protein